VSYIEGDLAFCTDYDACNFAVNRAREFEPDMDKHIQDFEMVFKTVERDLFCQEWRDRQFPPPDDPCVPQVNHISSMYIVVIVNI
jgi:hypothetical protein